MRRREQKWRAARTFRLRHRSDPDSQSKIAKQKRESARRCASWEGERRAEQRFRFTATENTLSKLQDIFFYETRRELYSPKFIFVGPDGKREVEFLESPDDMVVRLGLRSEGLGLQTYEKSDRDYFTQGA